MEMDEVGQDQPLRSQPETPHAEFDDDSQVPRRRRPIHDVVEKVTDETGEMVRGAFLQFLETYNSPRDAD